MPAGTMRESSEKKRLFAGIDTLSELDHELRKRFLIMEKVGRGCTFEDAETLAKYAGHCPVPPEQRFQ